MKQTLRRKLFKLSREITCLFILLLMMNTNNVFAQTPPDLGTDGVLSFTSESGVADMVTVTISGSDYNVAINSDGTLSNHQFPIAEVEQFRYMNMEMGSDMLNTTGAPNLRREMAHHQEYQAKVIEMADMFDLVRYGDVTVSSAQSGNWSSGSTWVGGVVPPAGSRVLIESGHVVTIDSEISLAPRTVRIDGGIKFSTTQNSSLKVDTMVGVMGSTFEMGTEINPIPEGITAKLIIENQGDFVNTGTDDPDYDPSHLGLGAILHGSTKIYGMKRTGYATFKQALIGVNSIKVDQLPADWKAGDKIVVAGTGRSGTEDEARLITGLGGNTVSFDKPLIYDHKTPTHTKAGLDLKLHVINLTRNAIITTQDGVYRYEMDGTEPKSRGHVMFMHTNNVDINYAGFYELGRTNKQGTMTNMVRDASGNITTVAHNPIARYPCHFHRTGANGTSFGIVRGSAVDGSPGWGFVNHRGAAYIENNVAYDVSGASFIAEVGNEIGTFVNNVSIRTLGNGRENFTGDASFVPEDKAFKNITEFGSAGDGFWFHSHHLYIADNVASGFTGSGYNFWNQTIDEVHPDTEKKTPGGLTNVAYKTGNGILLERNTSYGGSIGFSPNFTIKASGNLSGGAMRYVDQVIFNTTTGIIRKYSSASEFHNLVMIGDLEYPQGNAATKVHSNGSGWKFYNPHVEGWVNGIKFEHRSEIALVYGGYFNNVYSLFLGFRHDRAENVYFKDNVFGNLSESALNNVKLSNPGFDGVQVDYIGLIDDGSGDVLEQGASNEDGSGSIGQLSNFYVHHNGEFYKAYLKKEQHPDSIPNADPLSVKDMTNRQRIEAGMSQFAFCQNIYDPDNVIDPNLPDVTYRNIVLTNTTANGISDVAIGEIRDLTIELNQEKVILATELFARLQDTNNPTLIVKNNVDDTKVSAVLNGASDQLTIKGLALGESDITITTTGNGKTVFNVKVVNAVAPPVAQDDTIEVDYETTETFSIIDNDTSINAENGYTVTIISAPTNGSVIVNTQDNNSVSYTPNSGFSGTDSFTYTITDYVDKVSNVATVNITTVPEAPDYTISVIEGESGVIDITRPIQSTSGASYGTVTFTGTTLQYVQDNSGHNGTDSFTYNVNGQTGTITITIDSAVLEDSVPVANAGNNIAVDDPDGNGSEVITLDGSLSYDVVGTSLTYSWDIQGVSGSPFSGVSPTITVPQGTYMATLTVTDDSGKTDQSAISIEVGGLPNICLGKIVTATSISSNLRGASNVTDGNDNSDPTATSYWNSKKTEDGITFPQSVAIDLEKQYDIDQIVLNLSTRKQARPNDFNVDISDDGINWTTVSSASGTPVGQHQTFNYATPKRARYIRYEAQNPGSDGWVRVAEIYAYGTLVPNVPPTANAGVDLKVYDENELGVEDGSATFSLDGSLSADPDYVDITYSWQHTGGLIYAGVQPEITLPVGNHEFTLTVTDLDGATATDVVNVSVVTGSENIALYKDVNATSTVSGSSPSNINDASNNTVYNNDGGLPESVDIDLGQVYTLDHAVIEWETAKYGIDYFIQVSKDGVNWNNASTQAGNDTLSNTVSVLGAIARFIKLTVTSSAGANGAFGIKEFEVYKQNTANIAPTANAGIDATVSDLNKNGFATVVLNASASSDSDGTIVTYEWDIFGNATKEGVETTFNLPVGVNTITLTVTDNDGATNTDTVDITVADDNTELPIIFFYDFEDGLTTNIEPLGETSIAAGVISNPSNTSVNPSSKVLQVDIPEGPYDKDLPTRKVKAQGIKFVLPGGKTYVPGLRYLHAKIRTAEGSDINRVRLTGGAAIVNDIQTGGSSNQWKAMVFDLGSTTWDASTINMQLNFVNEPSGSWPAQTIYLDDIYLSNDPAPFDKTSNNAPVAVSSNYTVTDTDGNGVQLVGLDSSSSTDSDSPISSYTWSIPTVGEFGTGNTTMNLDIPVGTYNATLTATDIGGESGTANFTITVNPDPTNTVPVADAGLDQVIVASSSQMVTFDGSGSSDPDGTVVAYKWDVPGVGTFNGISASAVLPVGATTVTLTVTDNGGAIHTDTVEVTIGTSGLPNRAPEANAGADKTVEDANGNGVEDVTLNGASSSDPDGSITYSWAISGQSAATGVSPTVSLAVGSHTITLTVTDNDGATSTDTVTITVDAGSVANTAPVANANVDQINNTAVRDGSDDDGSADVVFDGTGSTDSDGTIASYSWDVPGVGTYTGANPTVSVPVGNYTVTLTVTDDDGATHTDTMDLEVLATNSIDQVEGFSKYHRDVFNGGISTRVSNPVSGGINTSSEVIQLDLPAANRSINAGVSYQLSTMPAVVTDKRYLRAKIYKNSVSSIDARININGSTANHTPVTAYQTAGTWEEIVWDLGTGTKTITTISIRPDRDGGTSAEVVYIDDIILNNVDPSANAAPIADAGDDKPFLIDTNNDGTESVVLDGSGSSDSDGTITYSWAIPGQAAVTGVDPTVSLGVGTHTITLTVTDDDGATDTDTVVITISSNCNSTFPYTESFESNNIGTWVQSTSDDFDWDTITGETPSVRTGDSPAVDGSYYIFMEADGHFNEEAIITSECFDLTGLSTAFFDFQYYMRGRHMGSLNLEISTDDVTWTSLWSISGDQGKAWFPESIDLVSYLNESFVKFRFKGTIGSGSKSDIAIDMIELSDGQSSAKALLDKVDSVGIEAVTLIYPNPSSGKFTISVKTNEAEKIDVDIYNLIGQKILTKKDVDTISEYDLSGYERGMYIINIMTKDHLVTKRLIIE
ncbi:PKD domain-containing protein [Tamlana sp. 2201CG12-4]|uniref:PKD domain-containing protein n=1 Tax=Tamlana sp. 2201CG12-4 TaxID=3112582 RepID=UPI002DB5667F|nr:PKD domain-containing protein [Tamlana sp. 2201CG12-4]MEC3905735.1 PKD domain-containing protein [Tamlana sp. 2201CG12-4]